MYKRQVNAWGYTLEQSYETERFPTEGDGLRLTIDSCIQHYLENALSYAVQEHHVAARAVGIVMDVNTGAVLAMSTTPSYDPNEPRVIADTAARNAVEALTGDARKAALQLAQQTQWRNKAVSDLYEPGSAAPALPWKLSRQCTPLFPAWPLTTSWLSGRRTPITATPVWWRRNWPCSCPCWCRQA